MDPVGLRVLKRAPAHRAPCKPSVQVKTWSLAALRGEKSLSFYWQQRYRVMEVKLRFYSSISGFIKGHPSCASLSPPPFILLEMWLPHRMLLFNLPLSLSLFLYPRSPSVLLCEVTCESDQLNPDHQLCLTYFRFGTLGFPCFHFCLDGISMNTQRPHEVWPAGLTNHSSALLHVHLCHSLVCSLCALLSGIRGFISFPHPLFLSSSLDSNWQLSSHSPASVNPRKCSPEGFNWV